MRIFKYFLLIFGFIIVLGGIFYFIWPGGQDAVSSLFSASADLVQKEKVENNYQVEIISSDNFEVVNVLRKDNQLKISSTESPTTEYFVDLNQKKAWKFEASDQNLNEYEYDKITELNYEPLMVIDNWQKYQDLDDKIIEDENLHAYKVRNSAGQEGIIYLDKNSGLPLRFEIAGKKIDYRYSKISQITTQDVNK